VCYEIFESLLKLFEARNKYINPVNYVDKWNRLRKLVDYTLDNLQEIAIVFHQEANQKWFDEVCKSKNEMELRTNIIMQIEYSEVVKELEPAAETEILEVLEIVKSGFQCSWLAHILNCALESRPISHLVSR
jgi:hypothetical protein